MDNYQPASYPSFVPNADQEDWNTFFDFSSAAAEPAIHDTGVGGTVPEFVPGDAGYLPGALDALGTIGGQAPQPTSFDCTLWNPIAVGPSNGSVCGLSGYEFSSQPSPISLGDVDFPFATPIASCDTDGISSSHTLSELPVLSNYGDQAATNVFEDNSEDPAQLEMTAFRGQTKTQATTSGQTVVQPGLPYPLQLSRCKLHGCQMSFPRYTEKLERHQQFHAKHHWVVSEDPFKCECGQECAKLDTLQRHIRRFQPSTRDFVCREPDCAKAFQRKDHLVQHLRHGHRYSDAEVQARFPARKVIVNDKPICHFTSCPYYRDAGFRDQPLAWQEENKPFAKQADYTKHMRDVHEWSPYPCDVPSCDKKDKKGYFNQKALLKHRQEQHPEAGAEPLVVKSPPVKRFPCGLPGCHVKLHPGSLFEHRSYCRIRSDEDRAFLNERYLHRG
ncbi:hypothetical protein PG995_000266 [Apiospora arundinis]